MNEVPGILNLKLCRGSTAAEEKTGFKDLSFVIVDEHILLPKAK
jgi:hypothetical protein